MSTPSNGLSLSLRESCASQVTQAIYARHASALARFGESGRRTCREDVLHHLDYLDSAMTMGTPAPMVQYVVWLRGVLQGRGVPASHLSESLALISGVLSKALTGDELASATQCLETAQASLIDSSATAVYGTLRLESMAQAPAYQASILEGNRRSALSCVTDAMADGVSLTQASVRIVQPAMYKVGQLWQENRVSVSQEHLASAISQNVLVGAYMNADFLPPNGKTAVFACVEGNQHALGLRILSDAFETQGWDAVFLGGNVPMQDLLRDLDRRRPALLALSASLPSHLGTARKTIEALRAELGNACPSVWIGGVATLDGGAIWRYTQADGWASDALQALDQL